MQSTPNLLMIRPAAFKANVQTMESNAFQTAKADLYAADTAEAAALEFDAFTALLSGEGLNVFTFPDTPDPETPDSIFPNNWVSFHDDGTVVLYPMMALNRRLERRRDILESLEEKGFYIDRVLDLSFYEKGDKYLEGTGSMVLDRTNRIAYACLSLRTNEEVLDAFCQEMDYSKVVFQAVDANSRAIYHTNVLMCVGSRFVTVCLDALPSAREKQVVISSIENSGKILLPISLDQMAHFAGNMLEVRPAGMHETIVMSSAAYNALGPLKGRLSTLCPIIHAPLDTIERNGGGSARCMIAEVHLPQEPKIFSSF